MSGNVGVGRILEWHQRVRDGRSGCPPLIHHPLSDSYLVYNDRRDTTAGQLVERALNMKVTNLFNF